jgi:hypothetical protein
MNLRNVIEVKPNLTKIEFDLPDEDIASFLQSCKDMDTPSLILIDGIVMHTGLFESSTIQEWINNNKPKAQKSKGKHQL